MSEVTSPILLDSTGQTTNTKLDNINTALGNINTILGQIKNVLTTPSDADDINYDNTQSGLTATNAQDAIDEINSSLTNLINVPKIFFREQTGTFASGGCGGLDYPNGFDNSSIVFLTLKYQSSQLITLQQQTTSGSTYTVYATESRTPSTLFAGSLTWYELWVNL